MKYILVFITSFYSLFINLSKAQTAAADNKPSKTITFRPIPTGPSVLGVFEGRPPCAGITKQLGITKEACEKLKCNFTFYRDPVTLQPTTYTLYIAGVGDVVKQGEDSFRRKIIEGKWTIVKGIQSNVNAEVYRLEVGKPGAYFYLLKGDDNVLFILDENRNFRIGNERFSYTLNRVELIFKNKHSELK
jgi:hypothetical protein